MGEYVNITSGEAPSKFEEGTELYVKVDDLNYNDKYVVDTQNKVAEHSTVKRVTKGSVVFPKRGAAIMTNKVRIMGIDSYMDTNMMALTSEKLDSEFLYNIISKEGLYKIADTSTIPQINNKHVEPYEVTIPSLDEQRRIGAYFKQLDDFITLHHRKYMKNIDLSLFAWEQRKLEDYLEVSNEKNRDELFGKEDVLSVSGEVGIVNQIEFQGRSFAGASVANYGIVEVGDVVYTKSPLKSNPYGIIKTNKGKTGIVSTLYAVYKPKENVDSEFVQIYFESDFRMNSYMHPLVNKGAKNDMKVSDANALKGPVFFPKIEEQIVKERIEGGANEKAVWRLFINCPFVCINFDFFWLNKVRQLYMDF